MNVLDQLKLQARQLLFEFKKENYIYGLDCLKTAGSIASPFGQRTLLVTGLNTRDQDNYEILERSMKEAGMEIVGQTMSARPNSPMEDILRIKTCITETRPDNVVVASGGSGIDATKAAIVLADLGGDFEDYFGVNQVSQRIEKTGKGLTPCIPIMTASGSAAHLTKYSNITDLRTHQKKLIVDDSIVPHTSLFDYSLTRSMPRDFTCDGAFDGLAHCLEVYYGADRATLPKIEKISLVGIELIFAYLKRAAEDPGDLEAREALGLATDLGGYAIMAGGTNGAHLTSFSLVDILSHGRACAILNPYYTVFFAPSIQPQLKKLAVILVAYKLAKKKILGYEGRRLGVALAEGLISLQKSVGFPSTLSEAEGFKKEHIQKSLAAAKDPQLEMKLKNMPVPLKAEKVDEYMGPILQAAVSGDFSLIKNIRQ